MNIQQFLSQQPIDKLIHQYFSLSISNTSQPNKKQQIILINSIVLYIAQNHKSYQFNNLFTECMYQIQVNNQDRDSVNKMARIITQILNKSGYLFRNIDIQYLVNQVLEFFLNKVFVTVCSADSLRCIWAIINAFLTTHPLQILNTNDQLNKCCPKSKTDIIEEQTQNKKLNNCKCNSESNCCKKSFQNDKIPKIVIMHEKITAIIYKKLLKTFKLHTKSYSFKVRKDIYKILNYTLKVIQFSQKIILPLIKNGQKSQNKSQQLTPFVLNLDVTKQQIIEIFLKNMADQKDPRNMHLILSNYLMLIELFQSQIVIFNYRKQIFENIQVYYPLSMQGDQTDFQIDPQDVFIEKQLVKILDQCLLQQIFKEQVRQMLIQKMLTPPIHEYVSLYVKYITKFNPNSNKSNSNQIQAKKSYSVLTMNLLQRLCQEQYLQQIYEQEQISKNKQIFTLSSLITNILKNIFQSPSSNSLQSFEEYSFDYEHKYIQFLNTLIVNKLFNKQQNNKHAGTIIQIVKEILNSSKSMNLIYGKIINFEEILIKFVIQKFMQFWSGKGDIAFKIGLLIIILNKKLQNIMKESFLERFKENQFQKLMHLLELLLITLGNIYQNYKKSDQVKIMVLKVLMIIASIFRKLAKNQSQQISYLAKIKVLNNHIIYKDCIKIGQLLKQSEQQQKMIDQNNEQNCKNQFSHSQIPILKCYIDYFMDLYVNEKICNQKLKTLKQILSLKITTNFHLKLKNQQNDENEYQNIIKNEKYFDIKMYGIIRFFSQNTIIKISQQKVQQQSQYINLYKQLSSSMIKLFMSKNKKINEKILDMIKYYNYQNMLKIVNVLLKNIKYFLYNNNNNIKNYNHFFINLSKLGKILSLKFKQYYQTQIQTQTQKYNNNQSDYEIEYLIYDIQIITFKSYNQMQFIQYKKQENLLSLILIIYLFKNVWINVINQQEIFLKLNINKIQYQIQEIICHRKQEEETQKNLFNILKQTLLRIKSIITIYSNMNSLQNINITQNFVYSQLQTSLLYAKFLKKHHKISQIHFNQNLVDLYQPGMIQFFWKQLINKIDNSSSNQLMLNDSILKLIQYIPENLMTKYAEKILPMIIFIENNEEKQKINNSKSFDYSKSQLICKIVNNLPQNSLILYVLPYCLNFLKNVALSIANNPNSKIQQINIQFFLTLQNTLAINKILYSLITKSQKDSKKAINQFQKLSISLENQKKFIINYLGKLIYHKKRIIRQSSRSLLAMFQQKK